MTLALTKRIMRFRRLVIASVIGLSSAAYAFANPGVAVCAAINTLPLNRLTGSTLVYARLSDRSHSATVDHLLSEARIRIQNTFGTPQSIPIVVFFNGESAFWPFKLNEYGSTHFLGPRTCIMVGPKGQNPDVIAHELMHAEIANRVGFWGRFTRLPAWFDEGLAMQVDFRSQYVLRNGANSETKFVKTLWSARDFFVPDDELLTKNYASAKAEVALWVADVGKQSVYSELERIRRGEAFNAVIKAK